MIRFRPALSIQQTVSIKDKDQGIDLFQNVNVIICRLSFITKITYKRYLMLSLVLNNSEFCKIASEFFKTEKEHFYEQDVLF